MTKEKALRLKPGARITFGNHKFTARCTQWWQGQRGVLPGGRYWHGHTARVALKSPIMQGPGRFRAGAGRRHTLLRAQRLGQAGMPLELGNDGPFRRRRFPVREAREALGKSVSWRARGAAPLTTPLAWAL
jgi:hypothetical protein